MKTHETKRHKVKVVVDIQGMPHGMWWQEYFNYARNGSYEELYLIEEMLDKDGNIVIEEEIKRLDVIRWLLIDQEAPITRETDTVLVEVWW